MKQKILTAVVLTMINFFSFAQTKTCTITCNVTSAYVCPTSNTWKSNPGIYNDAEFMNALGYAKDNKGCWKLNSNNTAVTIKTDNKNKAQVWWGKVKNFFSGASKSGF